MKTSSWRSHRIKKIEVSAHTKKRGHRKSLSESLEREEIIIELPESERFSDDGTPLILTMWGGFAFIVAVDFLSVWIKAYPIYKERERVEWENFGRKKTR